MTTTDAQIDAAILDAITDTGSATSELHPWAAVQQRVPGDHHRKSERLIALWQSGRVWLIKIAGRNYVGLGDAHDRREAAADPVRTPRYL